MSAKSFLVRLLTKPGYETRKYAVQRWLQRCGMHVDTARYTKFSYDACNFRGVPDGKTAVIFDVGANIGQSSIWFSKNFPQASIYAFEPFAAVYDFLQKKISNRPGVRCVQSAIGASDGEIKVARVKDPCFQCGQVVAAGAAQAETETIKVSKLDSFCEAERIEHVHILKTDTEGYDLDVLRGAERMLRAGRILNILTEASIVPGDSQHTNLYAMMDHLRPFGFYLHGIYDLRHAPDNGRLEYFNALFQLNHEKS